MKIPNITNRAKNIIAIVGLALILVPFAIVGIARAVDTMVLSGLESSLANNVAAITATQKACDSSYEALKAYKLEAKLAMTNAGNPCAGF